MSPREIFSLFPALKCKVAHCEGYMPMLRLAGTAVAMGNAGEPVKELADYVTAQVEEDGVSQALRHFGLLP